MKSIVKLLTGIGYVLLIVGTVGFTLYMVSAFNTVMKDKFDWDMPLAPVKAVAAMLLILLVANAAASFKESHPRQFGIQQVFVGCVLLMGQFVESPTSRADHEGFAVKFLVS